MPPSCYNMVNNSIGGGIVKRIILMVFIFLFSTYHLTYASFFDGDTWQPITVNPTQYIDSASVKKISNNILEIQMKADIPNIKKDEFLKSGVHVEYFVYKYLLDNNDKSMSLKLCSVYDANKNNLFNLNMDEKRRDLSSSKFDELYAQAYGYYVLTHSIWEDIGQRSKSHLWLEIGNVEKLEHVNEEIYRYWFKMQPTERPDIYFMIYDEVNVTNHTYRTIYRVVFSEIHSARQVQLVNNMPRYDYDYIEYIKVPLRRYCK